ncbi:hypothetical protein LPTSP4_13070 [Leptospira ryugenii]|uniref:Uncharacterized protein n=1 Tax=Leptospira ryugenii TaxID=1917863 RepID=A0A2P2DYS6_9LEPT|nr:hypothetical protein [Leptospira ryugenii]GBF49788.1 hypothetical protein LPTSP4_13070 [Leptospira ryugenii]
MSQPSQFTLSWPETRLVSPKHSPKVNEPSISKQDQNRPLAELWSEYLETFSGKQSRFAQYLLYLSTDFSGGLKVCSILAGNSKENPFSVVWTPPAPKLNSSLRDEIWRRCLAKEMEEIDRENWETLGFGFLLTGELKSFSDWVEFTEREFGLKDDCIAFLQLLGKKSADLQGSTSVLQVLVDYMQGNFEQVSFESLSRMVLVDGHWQISGILFHAIENGHWTGEPSIRFLQFLSAFFQDWKEWEQAQFLNVVLGKAPAFPLLRKAKQILNPNQYLIFKNKLEIVYRGDWEESDRIFAYDLHLSFDPFINCMMKYKEGGESFLNTLYFESRKKPYSFYLNMQMALVCFMNGEYDSFLHYYSLAGRLKHLPTPLYIYAKVLESRGNETNSNAIFSTLDRLGNTPVFPRELGDI